MEQLVYTQDSLYFFTLKKAAVPVKTDPSAVNYAEYDSRSNYPEMLEAYYEVQTHNERPCTWAASKCPLINCI